MEANKPRLIVREVTDVIEDYGMDYSEDGGALAAWFDKEYKQLVIEDEEGSSEKRFDLTEYILREVEAYVKAQAQQKYGKKANSISASNKSRRKRGLNH